ncbi:hypothetical protein MADMEL_269 [Erwinia phage vB_EamM_MadMel]|uniref:Uncharacterized protein n=1 Tax=Erwinia phage vB_EamM_MadMel TaxID=2060128 RepID=A0A2H5BK41_9CAUD|nr:hypothetical protein MADMEL_269 [Erwinia phage vB_EamM_MadMel]
MPELPGASTAGEQHLPGIHPAERSTGFFYPNDEYTESDVRSSRHLIHWDFGLSESDRSDAWDVALENPTFLTENWEYPLIRLTELYDDTFGIIDHNAETSPLSLILQVEQEDSLALVGYRKYELEYLRADILGKFGLSFDKWMKYPYCKRKSFIEAIRDHDAETPDASRQLKELQKQLDGMK